MTRLPPAKPASRPAANETTTPSASIAPLADASRSTRWILVVSFLGVVLCFVASTVFSQWQAAKIGVLSDSLVGNAMPSIAHLASTRSELRRVQVLVSRYPLGDAPARASIVTALADARRNIDADMDAYLRLPVYPGEEVIWHELRLALTDIDTAIANTRAYADAPDVPRALASIGALDAACDRGSAAVLADIEFNARNGEQIGRRIDALRIRALAVASALDAVSVLLTICVAALVLRAVTRQWELIRRHNQLLAERADELEKFAGRVAHDIRGPISAATMSLALVRRQPGVDAKIEELSARGLSSLGRASRFIDGLLEFARAGALTTDDAQASVGPVIASLVEDLRSFAEDGGVKLRCEALPECCVRCDAAILELLLANLVRNAIKYIGDGPERRVTVRAVDHRPRVRIEVEDTGVGVPPELRRSIFEPFVRGPTRGQPGVGLGLATVKRICGAHGGDVGVDDGHDGGSVFWFELPRAG